LDDGIYIQPAAQSFLKSNAKALDLLAIGAWVKFTEKFTAAPRLYEKIQGLAPRRSNLRFYKAFFADLGVSNCFYCESALGHNGHVDHFIPWRFVAENKIWNLVLACADCNSRKSSMTAPNRFADMIVSRNADLISRSPDSLPQKIRRDLVDRRGRVAGDQIHMLLDGCRADGFGIWLPKSGQP
jgi:hypothetical protein